MSTQRIVWADCTEAQRRHAIEIRDWWIANALSSGRMTDEEKAVVHRAVPELYGAAGLPAPRTVIVPSPLVMALAGQQAAGWWVSQEQDVATNDTTDAAYEATYEATRAAHAATYATYEATYEATRATDEATRAAHAATYEATYAVHAATCAATTSMELQTSVRAGTGSSLAVGIDAATAAGISRSQWTALTQGGNLWASTCAYIAAARDGLGLRLAEHAAYQPWEDLARVSGYRYVHSRFCLVTEKPIELHAYADAAGHYVPHRADGPSHLWSDGFAAYHLHGVRVPAHVVEAPETITVEEIQGEENAEVKRVMRERYGDVRYLTDIGATLLHSDTVAVDRLVPGGGHIHRALMADQEGNRFLLGSDGSTSRVYAMRVPPTVTTCTEAHEALSGLTESDCILEG